MVVEPATSKHRVEYDGARYHFCGAACRAKFLADPAEYLKPGKPGPRHSAQKDVIYTCPMHPQIRQAAPGNCPICGMALEPMVATEDAGLGGELADMTRRLWIGAALAVPVLVLEMGAHFPGSNLHHYVSPQASIWIEFVFSTPVVLWAGWPFFERGARSIVTWNLNMFTLIAIGTGTAYANGATYAFTASTTLYAQWHK